jgi:hypothetical protein
MTTTAGSLLKRMTSIGANWKGFNAARGERNLTRHMKERSERLAQSDVRALQRDVHHWELLSNDTFKQRYPIAELPVPESDRSKLSESFQAKQAKKLKARFVNAALGAVLGDPVASDASRTAAPAPTSANEKK